MTNKEYIKHCTEYLQQRHGTINENWYKLLEILENELNTYDIANECVRVHGIMIESPSGLKANPARGVCEKALVQIQKIQDSLGLSPKAQSRIKDLITEDEEDYITTLLN